MTCLRHLCYFAIPMTGKLADRPRTLENRISVSFRASFLGVLRFVRRDSEANTGRARQLFFSWKIGSR